MTWQNAQQRSPTRDEITTPERLHRLLVDMSNNFNRLQSQVAAAGGGVVGATGAMGQSNSQAAAIAKLQTDNVLSGVRSGPAALVELGIDPMATCKNNLTADVAPTATDDESLGYSVGSFWLNLAGPTLYFMVRQELTNAQWVQLN